MDSCCCVCLKRYSLLLLGGYYCGWIELWLQMGHIVNTFRTEDLDQQSMKLIYSIS